MSEVWTRWQGHVINGAFPLHRYLGSSDHSGVFLTESTTREPSEVALKLVLTISTLGESQLSDWNTAAGLAHPHLIRLLETGWCQLDGLRYLYAVMEYADQNLAQLLRHRALTEDEAREMLLPTLNALAFLHNRNLVQGQLKPANILVVGDQLKLASDTIRRVGEASATNIASVYEPPEAQEGSYSTAGDIWALGVSLFEALTRSPPLGLDERRGGVVLPRDFSPTFREIVAWCLSRRPYDRPKVTELEAWVRGQSAAPAPVGAPQPAAIAEPITPGSAPPRPATPERVARESAAPGPKIPQPIAVRTAPPVAAAQQSSKRRSLVPLILGAAVILALSWAGVRVLRTHRNPTPPTVQAPRNALLQTPSEAAPALAGGPSPSLAFSASNTKPAQVEAATSPSGVHEEIPNVPRRARRTIHGHVRVSVRLIVDKEGTVFAALVDEPGPSKYFQRLAIEAAKKWRFPPADTQAQRLELVRFDFTREGTTGRAVTLR